MAPAGRLLAVSKRSPIIYHDSLPSLRWQVTALHGKPIIHCLLAAIIRTVLVLKSLRPSVRTQ